MPNTYYPVFLNLQGRRCVVIGGGHEEEIKSKALADHGGSVTVVSPEITPKMRRWVDQGILAWEQRPYRRGDLTGAFVALAETGDSPEKRQIYREAEDLDLLLNVVDVTHLCIWIAPAVVRRGDVTLAISTAGASPALARKLREGLAGCHLLLWADLAPVLAEARKEVRRRRLDVDPQRWQAAINGETLALAQSGKHDAALEQVMAILETTAPIPGSEEPQAGTCTACLEQPLGDGLPPLDPTPGLPRYFPIYADLRGRRCVVVGGGPVAEGKVNGLLHSEAAVTVVGPELTEALGRLAQQGAIHHERREYEPGDLDRAYLAFAATDDPRINQRVAEDAARSNTPVNVVDNASLCSFVVPSVARRGDISIAISTNGASPALARRIKDRIERCRVVQWADAAPLLLELRGELRTRRLRVPPDEWQASMTYDLLQLYQSGYREEAYNRIMGDLLRSATPTAGDAQ